MAVITISRQYGSGGDDIAERICEILAYRYFDKSLMADVAFEVGLSATEIVDFSEDQHRVRGFLERLFSRQRVVAEARKWREDTAGARIQEVIGLDEVQSIALVRSIIRAAYKQGNVVIVGRGGQALLREEPGVLHVRIEAPLLARARHVQDREQMSLEAAQKKIAEREAAAADYLKRFYGIDWLDPLLYHLVINTGLTSVQVAVSLVVHAAQAMGSGA